MNDNIILQDDKYLPKNLVLTDEYLKFNHVKTPQLVLELPCLVVHFTPQAEHFGDGCRPAITRDKLVQVIGEYIGGVS